VDASVNGTCAATLPNQTCSGAVDNGVSAGLDPWIEGVGVATHPYANQKQYWPRYLSKKAEAKYNYHQNAPFNPDMPSV